MKRFLSPVYFYIQTFNEDPHGQVLLIQETGQKETLSPEVFTEVSSCITRESFFRDFFNLFTK